MRSKNHIKVVQKRPPHLVPKWDKLQKKPSAPIHREYDFEADISHIIGVEPSLNNAIQHETIDLPNEQGTDHVVSQTASSNQAIVEENQDSSQNTNEQSTGTLFHLEEDERDSIQKLFESAMLSSPELQDDNTQEGDSSNNNDNSEEQLKDRLRSAQRKLEWNSDMNGETVLTETK